MDIRKIKKRRGASGIKYPEEVKMDHCHRRLRTALVELANAISKGDANLSQRNHLRVFWEIMDGFNDKG